MEKSNKTLSLPDDKNFDSKIVSYRPSDSIGVKPDGKVYSLSN